VQTEEVSDSTKEPQTRASAGHSHDDPPIKGITTQDAFSSASATEALDMIDVQGLLRSSSVLASELNVDRLLTKLTKIILESTGAELTGIIVEDDDNSWKLAAISDTACSAFPTNEPLEAAGNIICTNIALGCLRFKETIITENVLGDSRFSNVNEEYRQRYPAGRAVCCMPIFHGQSTILGCVYIEGAPHTFAQRSTTVLRLLSSSVSTSIYNSMLFKKLEKVSASNAVMVESQKYALAKAREAEKKARLAEEEAIKNVHLKEEAAKAKALFLANVSHELRTPLNGVIGMSELLKGTSLTTEQHGYTESVRVCADTLLVIINDILDYSKLDAGKMVLHSIPMSIIETISEVVRALSFSNVHQRNVKTVTELDIDKDLLVMGDPGKRLLSALCLSVC
jgi:GAF domain-containing protein